MYDNLWYWNIYLKSRQHGVTTFWCILMLDQSMWQPNHKAAVIAHKIEAAKGIFLTKIRYPYENLPEKIREAMPLKRDTSDEFVFDNDSSVSVTTSARSGTLSMLHVSELGPICAKDPIKAREIISGSFSCIHAGSMLSIESTAMGRTGQFYDFCVDAQKAKAKKEKLGKLDFDFHFFGWWEDPRNILTDTDGLIIHKKQADYFSGLENKHNVPTLSAGQKAWYIARQSKDPYGIKSEHPSFWEEPFEVSIVGAFFKSQFDKIYEEGRICSVPHNPGILVNTYWDLGVGDYMSIWFEQMVGRNIHLINYFECSGEGFEYYKRVLDDLSKEHGYQYGQHMAPHDINVRNMGVKAEPRFVVADSIGLRFDRVPRIKVKIDGINASRNILPVCHFDEKFCHEGLVHLENYRKEWDEMRLIFKDIPLRDQHKHAADAFETMALSHPLSMHKKHKSILRTVEKRSSAGWT